MYKSVMLALVELGYTLCDTLENGDLFGHLQAWWEVATGEVAPDTRPSIQIRWSDEGDKNELD
jgi:hypothetical protein